jgi:CTP synthase (UTP-ammonia lyase)
VIGIVNAEHEESSPEAREPVVQRLRCSLSGTTERIRIEPRTLAFGAYRTDLAHEADRCSHGLNPRYQDRILDGSLRASGFSVPGADVEAIPAEVRIVERTDHPFFLATLFLPQLSSRAGSPHPLFVAYLRAALRGIG